MSFDPSSRTLWDVSDPVTAEEFNRISDNIIALHDSENTQRLSGSFGDTVDASVDVAFCRSLILLPTGKKVVFKNLFVKAESSVPFFIVAELRKDVYYTDDPVTPLALILNGVPPASNFIHLDYQSCRNNAAILQLETEIQNPTGPARPFVLSISAYHTSGDPKFIGGSVSGLIRFEDI